MPEGEWFCAFNPDPTHRSCSAPEQLLDGGEDGDGQLAVLHAPGFVPVRQAETSPVASTENVAFFQQLLRQRGDGNAAWSAPMAAVWWLASHAAVPVSHCSSSMHSCPRLVLDDPARLRRA